MGLKCEKSKRRRSGATSEPFCVTCSPSTLRSAACSRCVAEWFSTIACRRAASSNRSTRADAQRLAFPAADMSVIGTGQLTVSVTVNSPSALLNRPVSPTCPPDSA
jgi:hypothetical protein